MNTGNEVHSVQEKGLVFSALLFAGEGCKVVGTGGYLALFNARLAGSELWAGDQRAAPAAGITGCVLPAPVADPVFHGTHLRGIHTACEIEPVTGGEPAGGKAGRFNRAGGRKGSRGRCWGDFPAGVLGAAGCNERCGQQDETYQGDEGLGFHGRSRQLVIRRGPYLWVYYTAEILGVMVTPGFFIRKRRRARGAVTCP